MTQEVLSHALQAAASAAHFAGPDASAALLDACKAVSREHAAEIHRRYLPDVETIIIDIEGTTTPIPFVTTVLFPYAISHAAEYVTKHYDELTDIIEAMRVQAASDGEDIPRIPKGNKEEVVAAVAANLKKNSELNRKVTAMKSLQGMIWKDGYASGELKGAVFADVPVALKRWVDQGKKVYIYSSGSVGAQKLLFGQTTHGDLLPYLSGHFDTTSGGKREASSYKTIAAAIGVAPKSSLFLTDMVPEAVAADEAGMKTMLLHRPENLLYEVGDQLEARRFVQVTSFDDIFAKQTKRKRDDSA